MKFQVSMKDPDTLHDAIRNAVKKELGQMTPPLDEDEQEALAEKRQEKISELCSRWFKWSEYLTVEIDTDAKTCVVVPEK